FAHRDDARQAGDDAADRIRSLLDGRHAEKLAAQLAKVTPYLADAGYAAAFFNRLGPKATFDLLSRVRGNELVIVGRALALARARKLYAGRRRRDPRRVAECNEASG